MSDDKIIDFTYGELKELQKRISELEKRENYHDLAVKFGAFEMINQARHIEIETEIAELRELSIERRNELRDQLNELRDALQKSGVKWDFRLDEHGGFIDELKEFGDANKIFLNQEIFNNRLLDINEVLWELIQKQLDEPIPDEEHFHKQLLEKLDVGSARQTERPPLGILANMITEKKEDRSVSIRTYKNGILEETTTISKDGIFRKASGGDKYGSNEGVKSTTQCGIPNSPLIEQIKKESPWQIDDSKPPEPIEKDWARDLYEPREDDLCPICGTFLEPDYFAEHVKKFEVVKREDLEFLLTELPYALTSEEEMEYMNKAEKLKEEYKIE